MLLHWVRSFLSDELQIFIHPHHIILTHLKRKPDVRFKQKLMHQQVLSVDLSEQINQWDTLRTHLATAFEGSQWQDLISKGLSANVMISSHFVRYAMIAWSSELAVESERQAYLRYRFNALFGDVVKTWDLRMSEPDFGRPAIASGVDSRLLTALHEALHIASIKVNTIFPYLMLAINQTAQQIRQQKIKPDFWFVVIESERLCFALIEDGVWRLLKNVAIEVDLNEQIPTLIQRESVNCNVNSALPVVIYQMAAETDPALTIANYPTIKIQPNDVERIVSPLGTGVSKWLEVRV